jgi:hypothetical protein
VPLRRGARACLRGHCKGRLTQPAPLAPRSLSPVGKRALLGHEECKGVLRHHAGLADDVGVGARCRGTLAAMEGRRSAAPTPAGAAGQANDGGHLMIS